MYDPFEFVKVEKRDGRDWYVVNPGDVIPPTVERILECLKVRWVLPEELINPADPDPSRAAKAMVDQAYAVSVDAWGAALAARVQSVDIGPRTTKEAKALAETLAQFNNNRASALAIAWSWFKRALALKVGVGVLLHITKDLTYKE
jgi:hypothetical protein